MKSTPVDITTLESTTVTATKKYPVLNSEDRYGCLKQLLWDDSDLFGIIDRANPELRRNLARMTREVAKVCDKCATLDGTGFGRVDVETGHQIARFGIPREWDSGQVRNWCQRLYKYRHQLRGNFYQRLFIGDDDV